MPESEKEKVKAEMKRGLEALKTRLPGIIDLTVHIDGRLPSSNADVMLDSTFESAEALKNYSTHPDHVAVADGKVLPFTSARTCLDFEV